MVARPAPGSLAARSDLKNRLSFFRKRSSEPQRNEERHAGISEEENNGVRRRPEVSLEDPVVRRSEEDDRPRESPSVTLSPNISSESEVVLRNGTRNSVSTGSDESQAGWILKQALEAHFNKERPFLPAEQEPFDPPLAEYIKEVFIQLDYHKSGTVSREDFEILCRVLEISSSPPPSYRNSGIEWLSSYRTASPISPLKAEKMSDVKYNKTEAESEGSSATTPSSSQPPNFLFTFGPRPFWELWPQKKRRKKRLNLEEFTRCLLEQWAKSKGISLSKVNHCFPPITINKRRRSNRSRYYYRRLVPDETFPQAPPRRVILLQRPSSYEDTRARRLVRNVTRVTRRYHVLDRISHRLDCLKRNRRSSFVLDEQRDPILSRNGIQQQVEVLEKQVMDQRSEIKTLRDAIVDMRSSLHLSDAQNLALQVLLKKMNEAGAGDELSGSSSTDGHPKTPFPSRVVADSEKQLENLVQELREMSQTKYPSVGSAHQASTNYSSNNSNNSTLYNTKLEDSPFEEEIAATSAALGGAQDDLKLTQRELQQTLLKLQMKEIDLEENSINLADAYKALERAQDELSRLRSDLEEAQTALESTKRELTDTSQELTETRKQLYRTDSALQETEKRLSQISRNRLSLVLELNTTREILSSSLNKVQDLELRTLKVPLLEAKIEELEDERTHSLTEETSSSQRPRSTGSGTSISGKKLESASGNTALSKPWVQHPLRPLSTIDSGLYSTSSSDSDETRNNFGEGLDSSRIEAGSDEDGDEKGEDHLRTSFVKGLPPKPPSSSTDEYAAEKSASLSSAEDSRSYSPLTSRTKADDLTMSKLRREIQVLKKKFSETQRSKEQDRNSLCGAIAFTSMSRFNDSEFQVLEAERVRLSLLEEKIKEVLSMLKTLNSMNISPSSLGRLVLDAVEHSISPINGEIQVFKFLNHLYHGTRDYERLSGENLIHEALEAIEEEEQKRNQEL